MSDPSSDTPPPEAPPEAPPPPEIPSKAPPEAPSDVSPETPLSQEVSLSPKAPMEPHPQEPFVHSSPDTSMGTQKSTTPALKTGITPSSRLSAGQRTVAILPSMLTLGNLLSGFAAVFLASRPQDADLPWGWTPLTFAACALFVGMAFDGLDGRVARMTHQISELGEQLDSLADMVTFGVAPAFIVIQLMGVQMPFLSHRGDAYLDRITLVIGGIYVACTALRLARFNVELEQPQEVDHSSFKGLPSPGAAGTVGSLVLLHQHFFAHLPTNHWAIRATSLGMVGIMLLTALAMVGGLRYIHVINRYVRGRARFSVFASILIILMLLLSAPQWSMAGAFVSYALSAPIYYLFEKVWRRRRKKMSP